jgi:hypothetical protein
VRLKANMGKKKFFARILTFLASFFFCMYSLHSFCTLWFIIGGIVEKTEWDWAEREWLSEEVHCSVARWYLFKPKIHNFWYVNFGWSSICSILRPFGIFKYTPGANWPQGPYSETCSSLRHNKQAACPN